MNSKVSKIEDEAETQASESKSSSEGKGDAPAVESPFFTAEEAANYARCSVRTIQRLLKDGKLPRRGVGRPLIDKVELHDLMMAGKSREVG